MRILVNKMKMKCEKKLYGWLNNTIEQSRVTLYKQLRLNIININAFDYLKNKMLSLVINAGYESSDIAGKKLRNPRTRVMHFFRR